MSINSRLVDKIFAEKLILQQLGYANLLQL